MALTTSPDADQEPVRRRTAERRKWRNIRLAGFFLVFVAVLGIAYAALPGLVLNTATARQMLEHRLEEATGQDAFFDGDVSFSLLPRTRIVVDNVRLGRRDAVRVDRIIADLDPADALMGTATIARLVLIRPEYRPVASTEPATVAETKTDTPPHSRLERSTIRDLSREFLNRFSGLQILEVRDGVLRPPEGSAGSGFSNANVTVTQAGEGADMRLVGSFIWNGQPADFRLALYQPTRLKEGRSSSVVFNLQSPPMTADFTGQLSLNRNAAIAGRLQMSSPSLNRSLEWLSDPNGRVPDLGPITLDGSLRFAGTQAAIRDADITIAGSSGTGALEADFSAERPVVGGTLAFSNLDLDPFARTIAPMPRNAYDLDRPIDISFTKDLQLDIRLSAASAILGGVPLSNVAAVVAIGDDKAKLDVGDASVMNGRAQAEIIFDGGSPEPTVKGTLNLSDIEANALISALNVDAISVSGRTDITMRLTAPLNNWGTIIRNADVVTDITGRQGTIKGFDPGVFAKPGAKPLTKGTNGSVVPFQHLTATLAAHGPEIDLKTMTLTNAAGELNASGRISASKKDVDVDGSFAAANTASASAIDDARDVGMPPASMPIYFTMEGRWPNPAITTR